MKEWRFIQSGSADPAYNMAVDEAILLAHSEEKVPPTVRFYSWNPASLSLGYFQKAEEEVDFMELERQNIGFVRRPTGGRAVLHDKELTYSLIVAENYPGMPRSVTEAYRVLSEGLLHGFRQLNLQAEMVNLASEDEKAKYKSAGSSACFDSPSWYELVVEGRKVAGSAQMRHEGVILQHGSILLDLDSALLFSLLKFRSEALKARMKASFEQKAVAINDIRRRLQMPPVSLAEAEAAFARGIETGMDIRLVPGTLTNEEIETANRLAAEKYETLAWNKRR